MQPPVDDTTRRLLRSLAHVVGGAFLLLVFVTLGDVIYAGFKLDLGSIAFAPPLALGFATYFLVLGTPAAALLAVGVLGLAQVAQTRGVRAPRLHVSDTMWMVGAALAAAALAVAVRLLVLGPYTVTDDERAYEFSARLLLSGRLYAPSPPEKLHFDAHFLVNDGRYYTQYFLGWPALLAPFVALGIGMFANALYSALATVGIFLVVRRAVDSGWARFATVAYLASFLHVTAAATQLSHTSCLMLVAWLGWGALRSRDEAAPRWVHAFVALTFALAFFIRPLTAIAGGAAFLVHWSLGVLRLPARARRDALLGFGLVGAAAGALFFTVNLLQNGALLRSGYDAYLDYAVSNEYRFSPWRVSPAPTHPGFDARLDVTVARVGATVFNVNVGVLGWPTALVPALFALGLPRARLFWAAVAAYVVAMLPQAGTGVDTLGPIKYIELLPALLVLVALGLERVERWAVALAPSDGPRPVGLGKALAFALVFTALVGYWPTRLGTLSRIMAGVSAPERTVAAVGIERGVIFSALPWIPPCATKPTRHWVHQRPYNDPDLRDPVLWVNYVSPDAGRALLRALGDREGYVLTWRDCRPELMRYEDYHRAVAAAAGQPGAR